MPPQLTPNQSPALSDSGIKYAGFWKRAAARLFDLLLLFGVLHLVNFWLQGLWFSLFNVFLTNGYFVLFWTTMGSTPGKMLLRQRLRMRSYDGPVPVKAACKRILSEDLTLGLAYLF